MSLAEIADAVGGRVSPGDEAVLVEGDAFLDSRFPSVHGLFVAFAGERVDGHDYARAAVDGGASAVLGSRPVGAPTVVVDDVQDAIGRLARHVLSRVRDLTVIGLTGSQGKTSTKDMLAVILGDAAETVAPTESLNNEIGVPLTALRVTEQTRYLVVEMGARGLGHIGYLAGIVRPSVGLVLNVGVAHLGEFGNQEGIAAAKGELVESLPRDGLAVLNADDERVLAMAARTDALVMTFGSREAADVLLSDVRLGPGGHPNLRLTWRGASTDLTLRYIGEHQATNAAAAAATALGVGLGFDEVMASLRTAMPLSKWRMDVATSPDGVVVINDAYNANPDSMRAGVKALVDVAGLRGGARTFAVLGEMLELGDASGAEHMALGRLVAGLGITVLVTVGAGARPIHDSALLEGSWGGTAWSAGDPAEALARLRGELRRGDVVLVKASRAAGLEGLAAALLAGQERMTRTDHDR
jgi:UDP-N-acetylmuramoyl-tripeptide--D-alanyl-D-alanine ligase